MAFTGEVTASDTPSTPPELQLQVARACAACVLPVGVAACAVPIGNRRPETCTGPESFGLNERVVTARGGDDFFQPGYCCPTYMDAAGVVVYNA